MRTPIVVIVVVIAVVDAAATTHPSPPFGLGDLFLSTIFLSNDLLLTTGSTLLGMMRGLHVVVRVVSVFSLMEPFGVPW